jgi:hypothetical protein
MMSTRVELELARSAASRINIPIPRSTVRNARACERGDSSKSEIADFSAAAVIAAATVAAVAAAAEDDCTSTCWVNARWRTLRERGHVGRGGQSPKEAGRTVWWRETTARARLRGPMPRRSASCPTQVIDRRKRLSTARQAPEKRRRKTRGPRASREAGRAARAAGSTGRLRALQRTGCAWHLAVGAADGKDGGREGVVVVARAHLDNVR